MGIIDDLVSIMNDAGGSRGLTSYEMDWIIEHGGAVIDDPDHPNGWRWETEPTP
jgi:hypothetical protein